MESGYPGSIQEFYTKYVISMPDIIVVACSKPVATLRSLFGSDTEFVLSKIVEACTDKVSSNIRLANLAGTIYSGLAHSKPAGRVTMMESMVTLEQCSLDIRDSIFSYGCYINNRWLPYTFEKLLPDCSVLLQKPQSYEEFVDEIMWISQIDIDSIDFI